MKERINLAKETLDVFYASSGPERCGFIDMDNKAIEVANVAPDPEQGFLMRGPDIIAYTETHPCWATWHTHPDPNYTANLSGEDYANIKTWPKLVHFIIGSDGVRAFQWDAEAKAVVELE